MASNAHELFQAIGDETTGQKAIEAMVSSKQVESSFLDYKAGGKLVEKDIPKIWSKSLSAYANTGGGVVIWGVDCKKVIDPVTKTLQLDEPKDTDLHENPVALRERLADLVKTSTTDVVEGVQILAVKFNGGPAGCVVCFIPEGRNKPYRSMSDNNYYMRQPDRMEVIPHSLLRNLFYPRLSAKLQIEIEASRNNTISDEVDYHFVVSLRNIGKASARDTVVIVQASEEMKIGKTSSDPWKGPWGVSDSKGRWGRKFISNNPIHPNYSELLAAFILQTTKNKAIFLHPVKFDFSIYLGDGEAIASTLEIPPRGLSQGPQMFTATSVK